MINIKWSITQWDDFAFLVKGKYYLRNEPRNRNELATTKMILILERRKTWEEN